MTRSELRRVLGWALVISLTVAAITASAAMLKREFDETEIRVIATSIGFAVFSSLAAAGTGLRIRCHGGLKLLLANLTVAAAALGFVTLARALWGDIEGQGAWKLWGCLALLALACAHASVVIAARREHDSSAIKAIAGLSIVLGVIDSALVGLTVLELIRPHVDGAKSFGVLVIALILTSVLPPILRRLTGLPAEEPAPPADGVLGLARQALATADRIEGLANGDPQIALECQRLRGLAKYHLR